MEWGMTQGLAQDFQYDKRINDLRYNDEAKRRINMEGQAMAQAKIAMFNNDLEFQNGSNPFDSNIIKNENAQLLQELGKYTRENPDWTTNRLKSAQVKLMKQKYKSSDAVLRSVAYKDAVNQYQQYVQAAKKNPSQFNLDQLEEFKSKIDNYHRTGNADGIAGETRALVFTPPMELENLEDMHRKAGDSMNPDQYESWNNGMIGAFKGKVSDATLRRKAEELYAQKKDQYDYQYKNEPDKIAAIQNAIRPYAKTDVKYGEQDTLSRAKELALFEHNLKASANTPGISAYDVSVLNTDRVQPGGTVLAEIFTTTPPNFFFDAKGNKVQNTTDDFHYNGELTDIKKGNKRSGIKEATGYINKDLNWAKEQGFLYDPVGPSGSGETDLEVRPEHRGRGEIVSYTDKAGNTKQYFKLYATAVIDGNNPIYKQRMDKGMAPKLRAQAGVTTDLQGAGGPQIGEVMNGYEYQGGDPGSPNSWKKI